MENLGIEKRTTSHVCHIASSNSVKQHKLRKRIAWLSSKEGLENELVSLYIPSTTSIENVLSKLKNKSKSIHKEQDIDGLQDTIKNTIQHLKQKNEIPENGLALFSGNIVEDNQQVSVVEEIVPPENIGTDVFEISHHFHRRRHHSPSAYVFRPHPLGNRRWSIGSRNPGQKALL